MCCSTAGGGSDSGGVSVSGIKAALLRRRRKPLSDTYFKRMRAIEFTRQLDDGACPERWKDADLIIIGVSRSGKTPLSIFMAQRGFKVANYPLVPGVDPPKELFEVEPWRVFGLIVDPGILSSIRKSRVAALGSVDSMVTYRYVRIPRNESFLILDASSRFIRLFIYCCSFCLKQWLGGSEVRDSARKKTIRR